MNGVARNGLVMACWWVVAVCPHWDAPGAASGEASLSALSASWTGVVSAPRVELPARRTLTAVDWNSFAELAPSAWWSSLRDGSRRAIGPPVSLQQLAERWQV